MVPPTLNPTIKRRRKGSHRAAPLSLGVECVEPGSFFTGRDDCYRARASGGDPTKRAAPRRTPLSNRLA